MDDVLALGDVEWERLLKRLTHHALCKMHRLSWRGAYLKRGGAVPGAYEPQDFALDAVQKLLDGTRPWNRERYKTLEAALRASIDSDISHLVDSIDNKMGRRLDRPSSDGESSETFELKGGEPDPFIVVRERDWMQRFQQAAMKEIGHDVQLAGLLDCLRQGYIEPSDLAVLLDISPDEVGNLKKRLKRKLDKLDPQFKPEKKKVTL